MTWTLLRHHAAAALALMLPFTLAGCEDHDHDHPHAPALSPPVVGPSAHGHGHEDPRPFPAVAMGDFTVHGIIYGQAAPGRALPVDVMITPANLQAVRLWIGNEQATGSMRVRATAMGDRYHADIPVPNPLAADAQLWIELDTGTVRKQQAVALP